MGKPPVENVWERASQLAGGTARFTVALVVTGAAIFLLVALERVAGGMTRWFTPLQGLAINLILFEWAILWFMAVPVYPPERYFASRRSERMGRLYERLGIRGFGRLVMGRIRFTGNRCDLSWFVDRTRHAEAVHLLACFGVALFAGVMALRSRWDALFWTGGFNVPLHLYPIMLQRYNRSRAQKILTRQSNRGPVTANAYRPSAARTAV